jgi:hypothetical protein
MLMQPLLNCNLEEWIGKNRQYLYYTKKYAQTLESYYSDLNLSPSQAVLLTGNQKMLKGLEQCDHHYPVQFANIFKQMMTHEQTIHNRGNIVLYHGTSRFNYALSYLHTKLHDLFYEPSPGYLHLRQPLQETVVKKHRHDYLKQGGSWLQFNDTQHLLFCNCALTANLKQHLLFNEDSLTFFTQENTAFSVWKSFLAHTRRFVFGQRTKISIKKLFSHYGLEDFYTQHRKTILKRLDFKAPGNIMLQIEISPMLAQKTLFPAKPIGKRRSLMVNGKRTSNPLTILKTLSARPSAVQGINGTVWCLILTGDLLLNPHHPEVGGNIHFYPYSLDEEKRIAIEKDIDILVEEIHTTHLKNR